MPRHEPTPRRTAVAALVVVGLLAGTALNLSPLFIPEEVALIYRSLSLQDSARLLDLERGTTAEERFDLYLHLREEVNASSLVTFRRSFVDPANARGLGGIPVVVERYDPELHPDEAAALAKLSTVSGMDRSGWQYFIVDADDRGGPQRYRLMRLGRQGYIASEATLTTMGIDWRDGQ